MIATQMLMFLLCENLTEEFTTKLKYRSIIFCYERNSPLVNANSCAASFIGEE